MSNIDDRIRFTFRIPKELFEKTKYKADRIGVSANALILQILWNWAESEEKEKEVSKV